MDEYGQFKFDIESHFEKYGNINHKIHDDGTLLHHYCKAINDTPIEVFRYLIQSCGANINVTNKKQALPVQLALDNFRVGADVNILTYLLNQPNININNANQYGLTPLHLACSNIKNIPFEIFQLLIKIGSDVDYKDVDRYTPLHRAIRYTTFNKQEYIDTFSFLLSKSKLNINAIDAEKMTLFHHLCTVPTRIPVSMFELLIKHGADVNAVDKRHFTPLQLLVHFYRSHCANCLDAVMYLLQQDGINVNHKDNNGLSLLHSMCLRTEMIPVEVFRKVFEVMKLRTNLDERGVQNNGVNAQDSKQNTPLHLAFRTFKPGNDADILYCLLEHAGRDVNTINSSGYSPLHTASENISNIPLNVFKLLIEVNGAIINFLKQNNGPCSRGDWDLNRTESNLEHNSDNADTNNVNNNPNPTLGHLQPQMTGSTDIPLIHLALRHAGTPESLDIISYLFTLGIDTDSRDITGQTVLHCACRNSKNLSQDVFVHLISIHPNDINAIDHQSNTPLHISFKHAKSCDDFDIIMYLLGQNGININQQNSFGKTILHYAMEMNTCPLDTIKLIIEYNHADIYIRDNKGKIPLHGLFGIFNPKNLNLDRFLFIFEKYGIIFKPIQDYGNDDDYNDDVESHIGKIRGLINDPMGLVEYVLKNDLIGGKLQQYNNNITQDVIGVVKQLGGGNVDVNNTDLKTGKIDPPCITRFLLLLSSFQCLNTDAILYFCKNCNVINDYNDFYDDVVKSGLFHRIIGLREQLKAQFVLREEYSLFYDAGNRNNDNNNNNNECDDGNIGLLMEYFIEKKIDGFF
jgi:ankyrin repeat protein